jgi:hypothetical protein
MLNDMNYQSNKLERRKTAEPRIAQKQLKRLITLSQALMRARSVRDVFEAYSSAISIEQNSIQNEALSAVQLQKHTDASRQNDLAAIYIALIRPVAEKWTLWKFNDRLVDDLLSDPNATRLRKFRDAVFHASDFDDKDLQVTPSMIGWTLALDNALQHVIRKHLENPSLLVSKPKTRT